MCSPPPAARRRPIPSARGSCGAWRTPTARTGPPSRTAAATRARGSGPSPPPRWRAASAPRRARTARSNALLACAKRPADGMSSCAAQASCSSAGRLRRGRRCHDWREVPTADCRRQKTRGGVRLGPFMGEIPSRGGRSGPGVDRKWTAAVRFGPLLDRLYFGPLRSTSVPGLVTATRVRRVVRARGVGRRRPRDHQHHATC